MRKTNRSKLSLAYAVAAGLLGIAAVHAIELPSKFGDIAYQGVLFAGLIVACLIAAPMLIRTDGGRIWLRAAIVLASAPLVAFVISRTIGLPNAADDIGAWIEPTGTASVVLETAVVMMVARALTSPRTATVVAQTSDREATTRLAA